VSTKTKSTPGFGKRDDGTLYALAGRAIPGRAEWLAEQMDRPGFCFSPSFDAFLDDQADGETVEVEISSGLGERDSYPHAVKIRDVLKKAAFSFSLTHAGMIKLRDACAKAVEFFETGGLIGGPVAPATKPTKRPSTRRAVKRGGAL
jgi:hypothetical protein